MFVSLRPHNMHMYIYIVIITVVVVILTVEVIIIVVSWVIIIVVIVIITLLEIIYNIINFSKLTLEFYIFLNLSLKERIPTKANYHNTIYMLSSYLQVQY